MIFQGDIDPVFNKKLETSDITYVVDVIVSYLVSTCYGIMIINIHNGIRVVQALATKIPL